MSNDKNGLKIKVETWVLVAVWDRPFVFQGCFKITEPHKDDEVLFFFRCQSSHMEQMDILNNEFSTYHYEFTHLYNEFGLIQLNSLDQAQEDAIYLLNYALHTTLKEMLTSRKQHFISIDDIAMQAMINKIKPILNRELTLLEEDHIGFAVSMDFSPQEKTGLLAALALRRKLNTQDAS